MKKEIYHNQLTTNAHTVAYAVTDPEWSFPGHEEDVLGIIIENHVDGKETQSVFVSLEELKAINEAAHS
ncbi:hypothetical protein D3C86_2077610 [compost metagenome]